MKKVILIVLILIIFMVTGCSSKEREDIVKLTYHTVDYNGGYTTNAVLDFENNEYRRNGYLPEVKDFEEPELQLIKTFTDEEKKEFIKGINNAGLLKIKDSYKKYGIIDGGGWTLIIEFSDGTSFKSTGDNDGPYKVFNKCSTYFFDLCGEAVMGMLPKYYKDQPNIMCNLKIYEEDKLKATEIGSPLSFKANFKWNKISSLDNDYFLINNDPQKHRDYNADNNYKIVFETSYYDYDEKFQSIKVYEYNYNSDLSNEKIIFEGKWFTKLELDLELDKIYVYRLEYKNGNFVEYTFNTRIGTTD